MIFEKDLNPNIYPTYTFIPNYSTTPILGLALSLVFESMFFVEIQYWNSGIIAIGSGGCISILKLVSRAQLFFSEFHFGPSCQFSKTHGYFEFLDLPLAYLLHPIVANLPKYCALAFLRAWVIGTQALKKQRSTAIQVGRQVFLSTLGWDVQS